MLNLVREGEEDYIEAIRYRRRLKIFENFLFILKCAGTFGPLLCIRLYCSLNVAVA